MQAYRTETTIVQDGKLSIGGVPFRKGDEVEVIGLIQKPKTARERYLLRGQPISYHQPFHGIAEEEWEALK